MAKSRSLAAAVSLFLITVLAATPAQKSKEREDPNVRSVTGVVRDGNDTAVEGAVVQLKNTKTLEVRSFVTQTGGVYSFHGLSTNADYELKAEYQGASSAVRRLSIFDSRRKAVINLKLESKQ